MCKLNVMKRYSLCGHVTCDTVSSSDTDIVGKCYFCADEQTGGSSFFKWWGLNDGQGYQNYVMQVSCFDSTWRHVMHKTFLVCLSFVVPCPSDKVGDGGHQNVLRPTDHPSLFFCLRNTYFKNYWTFRFHLVDVDSSWHYLNLIRSRHWLAELCCYGNHLGNLACVRNISGIV